MKDGSVEQIRPYPSPLSSVEMKEIIYWSKGLRVKGLLAKPVNNGQYEALLYLRGGLQSVGMVRPARIAQFAQNGFIVFAPYYRGNRGGEGRDEMAGNDRYDAVNGVTVLKNIANVEKVHVYGFSRGGIMALWTAILREDVQSVVCWAGVCDMKALYDERIDMRRTLKRIIGGSPNKVPNLYEARTPLHKIDAIHCPVLIIHGMNDVNVRIEQSYALEEALKKENKQVETWYYENLNHHFPPLLNLQVVQKLLQWMKKQEKMFD